MLPIIVIVGFFTLFICSYTMTKSFVHPAVIVSLLWGIILLIYQTVNHDLFPLSERFFRMIFLWVSLFCIASLSLYKIKINFPRWIWASVPNPHLLRFLFPFLTLATIYNIYRLYTISEGSSFYNIMQEIELPLDLQILAYVDKVSLLLCLCMLLFKTPFKKYEIILFTLLLFTGYALVSVKTVFCQLLFAFFFTLYYLRKLTLRRVLTVVGGFTVWIVGIQMFRGNYIEQGKEFKASDFLLLYALSPLPACDMVLNHEVNYQKGKTLRFFDAIAAKAGIAEPPQGDGEDLWVKVPIPTNAYTVMFKFYNDYGQWGVGFFSVILGLFWGILYKGVQYGCAYFILLYAVLFYTLPFQFFADFIFTFFSVTLQIVIIASLFFVRFRFKITQLQ